MRKSNYDMMAEQVRELFLQYDQQVMIDKFNLKYDAEYLYPVFLGTEYRIDRLSGAADFFSGKTTQLALACTALGGKPGEKGDVSFIIPVFDFFPVYFQFWEADEEFPAQISFFMDRNALQLVHYETLWFMLSFLVGRLREKVEQQ